MRAPKDVASVPAMPHCLPSSVSSNIPTAESSTAEVCHHGGEAVYVTGHSRNQNRKSFFPVSVEVMKSWLLLHVKYPYPTEEEKREMEVEAGLSLLQINNWFINARRRIVPMIANLEATPGI